MRKFITLVVIVGLITGGFFFWQKSNSHPEVAAQETTMATAKRGSIRQTVECTGKVVANLDVDIKCKASGEVVKLPFDISDHVNEGELIVELDPIDEERMVKQSEVGLAASKAKLAQSKTNLDVAERNLKTEEERAEADLRSAQARAEDARAKAERQRQLLQKKLASQEEFDTAQTAAVQSAGDLQTSKARVEDLKAQEVQLETKRQDIHLAEAEVQTDEIALSLAKQRLKDTQVHAPISGVVSGRTVQIGQIISSGISNVGGGTTILTISDLSHMFVLASVDESDIGNIKVGLGARVTVDAFPRIQFAGKVVRIATKGVNLSNVVTFEVKIEIVDEKKTMLKSEMTANVEIIIAEKDNVVIVPTESILRKEGKSLVTAKAADGATEDKVVKVGIMNGTEAEILEGINENEAVIVHKSEAQSRWRAGGDMGRGGLSSRGGQMMMRPGAGGMGGGNRR